MNNVTATRLRLCEGNAVIFGVKYPYHVGRPFSLEDAFELTSQLGFNHVELGRAFLKNMNVLRSVEFITTFRQLASIYECEI
jgi:hypothetical protein